MLYPTYDIKSDYPNHHTNAGWVSLALYPTYDIKSDCWVSLALYPTYDIKSDYPDGI